MILRMGWWVSGSTLEEILISRRGVDHILFRHILFDILKREVVPWERTDPE
jgi:hypothetical protein